MVRHRIDGKPLSRQKLVAVLGVLGLHCAGLLLLSARKAVNAPSEQAMYFELLQAARVEPPKPMVPAARAPVRERPPTPVHQPANPVEEADTTPAEEAPSPVVSEFEHTSLPETRGVLEKAKLAAGPIDKELRKGKSGVPLVPPDTPMARFRLGIEAAYKGGGAGFTTDRYVAPDGVVITRMNYANGPRCYISKLVNASPAAMFNGKMDGGARRVSCPTGSIQWQRQ